MKFLVPNYSCLQNPWLRGYRPQIPFLSVLNWICWTPPPRNNSWVRHWLREVRLLFIIWYEKYIVFSVIHLVIELYFVWTRSNYSSSFTYFCFQFLKLDRDMHFRHFWQNCEKRLLALSCLSVRMEQLCSHWTDSHEIWYWSIFRKSVENLLVSLTLCRPQRSEALWI